MNGEEIQTEGKLLLFLSANFSSEKSSWKKIFRLFMNFTL
jgi:hypothetical protein